jgi:hypothetical protein
MKKALFAFSLLSLSFVAACGGVASKAAGVYELDKASLRAAMLGMMPPEAQKEPKALEAIDGMVNGTQVSFDLKADGTAAMNAKTTMFGKTQEDSATGTWKLDGSKLTIQTKDKAGKEETKTVDYVDGSFSVEEEKGGQKMKMTFRKK